MLLGSALILISRQIDCNTANTVSGPSLERRLAIIQSFHGKIFFCWFMRCLSDKVSYFAEQIKTHSV